MSGYWQRFADMRVSRRRMLRALGSGAVAAGLIPIAGCSSDSGGTGESRGARTSTTTTPDRPDLLNPGGIPRSGGTFITSEAAEFGTFDPHLGIALASAYFPRVYNVLVNQSATKPEFIYFDLASSLETPDEQTFIFHIRPGVKVTPNSLGVPERDLDAEDVRVNLDRISSLPAANNYAFVHDYIDSTVAEGDTVTIRTTSPYAWFLNRIGLFVNTIAPRELLTGDPARMAQQAAGAGPFVLASLREGEGGRFERNPNYYRTGESDGARLPYLDAIDLRVIVDRSTARTAFVSGQMHRYTPSDALEAQDLASKFVIQRDPNFSYIAFTMNPRQKPFDDPRVRRAFSRAIDRTQYADIIYGGEAKPDGLVHWSVGSYALDPDELATTYQPYDVEEARRLVEQVGGIRVRMMYPAETLLEEHDKHLPIFLEQMRAAGIQIDSEPQALPAWIDNYRAINYQCSLALNQFYETPEIPLGFHTLSGPLADGTYVQGLGDPEIEAAVKKSRETLDINERIQAVHDAQKIIYAKDPMMLPLVTPYTYQAYWDTVHDIPAGVGTTAYLLNTLWLDPGA
ncbi:MAG: ABC transporter substrate-binding protein [Dehalococcoidia bacterium]